MLISCAMDATMKPVRCRFDSEKISRGKAGPRPDVRDDAVEPSRPWCLAAAILAGH